MDDARVQLEVEAALSPWREARDRQERLDAHGALGAPPKLPQCLDIERIAIDPLGRWLVVCSYSGVHAISLKDSSARRILLDSRSGKHPVFSDDGSLLVVGEGYEGKLYCYALEEDTIHEPHLVELHEEFSDFGALAISPDNETIACAASWANGIYSLETGSKLQELETDEEIIWARFSPDGQTLYTRDDRGLITRRTLGQGTRSIEEATMALGHDGATLAVAKKNEDYELELRVYGPSRDPFEAIDAVEILPIPDTIPLDEIHWMEFIQHDQTLLVFGNDSSDDYRGRLFTMDALTGELLGEFGSSFEEEEVGFANSPDVYLAVSEKAGRVYYSGWGKSGLESSNEEASVFILDLHDSSHLGNIRGAQMAELTLSPADRSAASLSAAIIARSHYPEDDYIEATVPMLSTPEGFFSFPTANAIVTDSPFDQPELVRARLRRGAIVHDGADEVLIDRVLDLRVRLLLDVDTHDQSTVLLSAGHATARFLNESGGLSHLTLHMFMKALETTSRALTLGNASFTLASVMDNMTKQCKTLREADEAKLERAFDEMCKELELMAIKRAHERDLAEREAASKEKIARMKADKQLELERHKAEVAEKEAALKAELDAKLEETRVNAEAAARAQIKAARERASAEVEQMAKKDKPTSSPSDPAHHPILIPEDELPPQITRVDPQLDPGGISVAAMILGLTAVLFISGIVFFMLLI